MAKFQESEAKQAIRHLIRGACEHLHRPGLTYLGLPAESALDIKELGNLLRNVICIDEREAVLNEARRSIAGMRLNVRKFEVAEMWHYLRDQYRRELLVADVTFLDFYGGGIRDANPFAAEIAGLRDYFVKHAGYPNRAFVLAWTYMPRDKGRQPYQSLDRLLSKEDIQLLERTKGLQFRSVAIRLLLRQLLNEHMMSVKVFQHAVYKQIMSTIILVFSKGLDPQCTLTLESPDSLRDEPCYVYTPGVATPQLDLIFNI